MTEDSEKTKRLIAFKRKIEDQIALLETELKEHQATLEMVDSILLAKGFKHPEIKPTPTAAETRIEEKRQETPSERVPAEAEGEPEGPRTLKTSNGETLAQLHVIDDSLHVVLAEDKNFNINTPPFNQFLIQRVLLKMQERDSELARSGQLSAEKILCFDIIRDGDTVQEIVIRNFDSDRLRELSSSIRWTLEKMYEKMKA